MKIIKSKTIEIELEKLSFGSYTEKVHKIRFDEFKSYVVLNQLFVKVPFARSCIVSSKGTLVNRDYTSYETKNFSSSMEPSTNRLMAWLRGPPFGTHSLAKF